MTGSPGPSPSDLDAIVIGGGHSGLATSLHLARRAIDHVVLERGRIGETWRGQRWDSFTLNTPGSMNRLPGDLPAGAPDAGPDDGFQPRDAWVARLDRYAVAHGLPVRQGVEVVSVRAALDAFEVDVRTAGDTGAGDGQLRARAVVVASGSQTVPLVPAFTADLPPGVNVIHAAAYRRPSALAAGAVLVVGTAQSGRAGGGGPSRRRARGLPVHQRRAARPPTVPRPRRLRVAGRPRLVGPDRRPAARSGDADGEEPDGLGRRSLRAHREPSGPRRAGCPACSGGPAPWNTVGCCSTTRWGRTSPSATGRPPR